MIRFAVYAIIFILLILIDQDRSTVKPDLFALRSVDTMKYSRDLAREKLQDPTFRQVIDTQVASIAALGATHVAVATPYDDEFVPFLQTWVEAARKNKLKVWFRGNFSGWEQWFGYPRMTPEAHTQAMIRFITVYPNLFADGDIFTSCTECENGALGDPRETKQVAAFRNFLIDEQAAAAQAFTSIGKTVESGYFPMNYDVARLIMDPATTRALGGVVVIDHYVPTPEQLAHDVVVISQASGGQVVLGEIGVYIADIHGTMTDQEKAVWLENALAKLSVMPQVVGVNYWVNVGGSTALWSADGQKTLSADVIGKFFLP